MNVGSFILALVVGTIILNILGPLRGISEKRFGIYKGMLPGLQVEVGSDNIRDWMLCMVTAAILLEVVIPGVIYAALAAELGRSDMVLGMLFWGGAWLIGALPQLVFEPMLVHVPRRFVIHNVVWSLLIYLAIGAAIGGIYRL